MPRARRFIQATRLLLLLPLAALSIAGDVPDTRKVTLRWEHPDKVAGFKIYTHVFGQPYRDPIDVGLPPLVDGVYSYELVVSNLNATWVKMTAYNAAGVESRSSREKVLLLDE